MRELLVPVQTAHRAGATTQARQDFPPVDLHLSRTWTGFLLPLKTEEAASAPALDIGMRSPPRPETVTPIILMVGLWLAACALTAWFVLTI